MLQIELDAMRSGPLSSSVQSTESSSGVNSEIEDDFNPRASDSALAPNAVSEAIAKSKANAPSDATVNEAVARSQTSVQLTQQSAGVDLNEAEEEFNPRRPHRP